MRLEWVPAGANDLEFARTLTRRAMMPYYMHNDLLWRDGDFDTGWSWRDNRLVRSDEETVGFISLSSDARALYVREFHLLEAARGKGYGGTVLEWVQALARERRLPAVRLTVFKENPAQALYGRKGFEIVGEDDCFWRMEWRS